MKRLAGLDSFKAVACLMVIMIHVTAAPVTVLANVNAESAFADVLVRLLVIFNRFAKPSVPMFIFASGLALYYRYGESRDKEVCAESEARGGASGSGDFRYFEFLKRRVVKIVVPYALWCAVYYGWFICVGVYEFDAAFFAVNLLSGKMMYHLYFVIAIVQYYLLFGVFRRLTANCSAAFVIPSALAVNLAEVCLIADKYYGRCFLTYITVFLLGTYTAKHIDAVNRAVAGRKALVILGAASLAAGAVYTMQFTRDMEWERGIFDDDKILFTIFSILASLFIYGLCVLLAEKANGGCNLSAKIEFVLGQISKGSFYIFLAHPLAMLAAGELCRYIGVTGVLREMAVSVILILVFCIPLAIAYANLRAGRHKNRIEKNL